MTLNRDVKIQYLGHSTFLITTPAGKKLLIDPWVASNPACPKAAQQIDRIDSMLITHGHADHMQDAVSLARKFQPKVACNYEISLWLAGKGIQNVVGMNKGGAVQLGDLRATMVNAHHSSSILEADGTVVYAGEAAGFVVKFDNGFCLYHAGDTSVFGDMKLIAELYQPELVLLPIGDLFTMGPKEAAEACRLLNARKVIPMHYGTFPVLTGTPRELTDLTRDLGTQVIALQPGETLT